MAAAMFTLLFTAFLPKVGVQFDWVTYHWIAGTVLTVSILFHIIHASFFLDFWSIWPDRMTCADAMEKNSQIFGPSRAAAATNSQSIRWRTSCTMARSSLQACLSIVTGVFMMFRVRTISSRAIRICSAT